MCVPPKARGSFLDSRDDRLTSPLEKRRAALHVPIQDTSRFAVAVGGKQIPGKSEAEIKSALMAMVSNKATAAPQENDDDPLFG